MIRPATVDDIPAIVAMGAHFIEAEYVGAIRFNADTLAQLTRTLIEGAGVVFVAEQAGVIIGMMALTTYVHGMSGDTIATEVVWWIEPKARGGRAALKLFTAGEAWARFKGATKLQMIAPSNKVGALYERLGFEKIEVHYQRSL